MGKRLLAAALAALLWALPGCGKTEQPPPEPPPVVAAPPAPDFVPEPSPAPVFPESDPIDDLLSGMTLEEKVGQLFFVRVPAEDALEDVSAYHLGGYILFGRDTKGKTAAELIETIAAWQENAPIPLLIGVDEEGGSVVRLSSNPNLRGEKFAAPRRVLERGGLESLEQDTHEKDRLLRALGFNVNLAPVVDLAAPGSFIYDRTFGLDGQGTHDAASAMVRWMCADGMGSVLKHFPGYGDNVDTHTGIAVDDRPAETFTAERELKPFLAHQNSVGCAAILVSHNIISAIDPELPASLSPAVHDTLRRELDFDGVVMTDDLAMDAVSAYAADGAVAVLAIEGGNDIVLTTDYRTQIPKVLEAVETGRLSEDIIDTACRRILTWKTALGLLK